MHEGKFTELHHIKSTEYLLTTPPKSALDKLAEITDLCLQREIPTDRIRLVWWELGGSDAGWYFDWQGWRGKSYQQERSRRNDRLTDRSRDTLCDLAHIREMSLPDRSSAWALLSPDEAISAGFESHVDLNLGDALPRALRIPLWTEEVFVAHVLELRPIPAQPAPPDSNRIEREEWNRRAVFGEIVCTRCQSRTGRLTEAAWQLTFEMLQGTRSGSTEEQIRLAEFRLRDRDDRGYPVGELNRNRERVRGLLTQPFRENHPLACKEGRVP